jgi:hypothetical protein
MNKIKNLALILLILIAIVQTNILWLQNISHHNFFYKTAQREKIHQYHLAQNFKLEIKNEKNLFAVIYKPDDQIKKITDDMLKEVFEKGKFVSKTNFDFDLELKKTICIYDYDFFISVENFASYLGTKPNNISKLKTFNKIFFESDAIAFVDTLEKKLYRYQAKNKFDFSSLLQQKYEYDKNLIPVVDLSLPKIKINNPYAQNNDLLMNTIEKKLDCFFINSANKNIENVNNIFTFSNNSVVVKYYPENVLEYTNYQTQDKSSDLLNDYAVAINFIKKDTCVTNDFILKRYEQDDCQSDFYFDYVINNVPVEIEKNFAQNIELENFIYVSVKNGVVSKYKKVAFNFIASGDYTRSKSKKYVYGIQEDFLSQF